jgi:hypothetical protein
MGCNRPDEDETKTLQKAKSNEVNSRVCFTITKAENSLKQNKTKQNNTTKEENSNKNKTVF